MAHLTNRGYSRTHSVRGFSLIEVLVAVVILATGLLALTALQVALARNASDAKARSAVMSAMTSRMAEIRRSPPAVGKTWTMSTSWVSQAAEQAGTSNLQLVEAIGALSWNGTTYVTSAVTKPLSKFTRATLTATWTAADGAKTLALSSDFSGNIYGLGKGYPTSDPTGSAAKYPIVRQDNPSSIPGVIPIASGNQATAASNPQPILKGRSANQVVGTSFDVLTYVPEGATAKIQKRFETQVVKCRCQFEAGSVSAEDLGVAGKAQWPAVWNGDTYAVADVTGAAPGVAAKGIEDPDYSGGSRGGSTRAQSEQCTECCRDRHDTSTSAVKFDPEASVFTKYDLGSTGLVTSASTPNKTYVESCRVVRVGGLWRTTADMYARQFGLLETTTVSNVQAKDGTPNATAVSAYTTYVKGYLGNYDGTSATPPLVGSQNAQDIFVANATLQLPAKVSIAQPSVLDQRYLHARGLFVDYLEADAKAAIVKAAAACTVSVVECILPYLPFTTINLTEMATWTATSTTVLSVNSGSLLQFDVDQPFGGRTRGIAVGEATNRAALRKSNSGVAASDDIPGATDLNGDELVYNDGQLFEVLGSSSATRDRFYVNIPAASATTGVTYAVVSPTDSGGCYGNTSVPTKYDCATGSTMPKDVDITVAAYNREQTLPTSMTATCTIIGGSTTRSATANRVPKPVLQNYSVSAVTGGTGVTINPAVHDTFADERTVIRVNGVAKDSTIQVTLSLTSTRNDAEILACTTDSNGNGITVTSWNKPWTVLLP